MKGMGTGDWRLRKKSPNNRSSIPSKKAKDQFKRKNTFLLFFILIPWLCLGMLLPFAFSGKSANFPTSLPPLKPHPLPSTLVQWQEPTNTGDYFDQVKPTEVGYLVWSEFPIKVYVETATNESHPSRVWVEAVLQAVREWGDYLPLEVVNESAGADIKIMRSRPPLRASFNRSTGEFQLPRVRAAETRYEFYIRQALEKPAILSHRFTINLSPNQAPQYTQASARHELGHALGIWGHSPIETDALYFSQVRNPPLISRRDINTLKRIYQQSTRLGWPLPD